MDTSYAGVKLKLFIPNDLYFIFPFSHASYHTLSKNTKFLMLPRKRQLIITQYITYQSVVKH